MALNETNQAAIEYLEQLLELARTREIKRDSVVLEREADSVEMPRGAYIVREPTGWFTLTFSAEFGPNPPRDSP